MRVKEILPQGQSHGGCHTHIGQMEINYRCLLRPLQNIFVENFIDENTFISSAQFIMWWRFRFLKHLYEEQYAL